MSVVTRHDLSNGLNNVSRSVAIHWSVSHALNVTRYTVRVSPSGTPCGGEGSAVGECVVGRGEDAFERLTLSLGLWLGVEYVVTVATTNCGTQIGSESDPIIIDLDCKSMDGH